MLLIFVHTASGRMSFSLSFLHLQASKKYTLDAFQKALTGVQHKWLNLTQAAKKYGVPKATLHSHVIGLYQSHHAGPRRLLKEDEEKSVANYLLYMARHGLPVTRTMIRCYLKEFMKKRSDRSSVFNLEKGPSDEWFRNFYKRHPELSEPKAENKDGKRKRMTYPEMAAEYFTLLEKVLTENGLKDKPSHIYNCDETGRPGKEAVKKKVVGSKTGQDSSPEVTTTDHITAHLCICADGTLLPTMVTFKDSLPSRSFHDELPDSWLFACNKSGEIDGELFYTWFEKLFLPYCTKQRPVLLIMDNHESRITLKVVEKAMQNDIVLMGLPAQTKHFLQPLDVNIIKPLKTRFSTIANKLGFVSQELTISKSEFPVVLKYSLDKTTPSSIRYAFKDTGICPFKPDEVHQIQLVPSTSSSVTKDKGNDQQNCETLNLFLVNPLASQGLTPQRMESILVESQTQPLVQGETQEVPSAGVLTGEEMLMQLKPERKKRGQGYRQYDLEKLRDAYNYVMETGSSVKGAAREFDVPETTLRDRVLNRISVDSTTYGRATVLNEEEETKLINHLKDMADIGYGFTQQEIVRKASDYAVELGKRELTQAFTYRWYRGFAKRHPPEPNHDAPFTVSKKALLCRNGKCITNYYNQLNRLIKKSNVDDKPGNIYLVEEVDIEVPTDEKFQTVTFIGAGNAAGQKIPPYFIVASGLTEEYHNLMRKSQLVTEGMKVYLQCHFLKYITRENESDNIIVLYDAHRICLSLQLIDWAKSMNILLFPLPPQTTYFVKACGEGLFQTIKKKYNAEYGEVSPYKHLTSTSGVVSILKTLYGSEVTSSALEEFFSKCGVCPLQESEVMCDFLKKQGLLT